MDNCRHKQQCAKPCESVASLHHSIQKKLFSQSSPQTSAVLTGLFKCGSVPIDSGAQVSFLCQDTTETLALKRKDVSITIAKVGREGESMKT